MLYILLNRWWLDLNNTVVNFASMEIYSLRGLSIQDQTLLDHCTQVYKHFHNNVLLIVFKLLVCHFIICCDGF